MKMITSDHCEEEFIFDFTTSHAEDGTNHGAPKKVFTANQGKKYTGDKGVTAFFHRKPGQPKMKHLMQKLPNTVK